MRRERAVATDQAGETVPRALARATAQNPHAPRIPLIRLEAVDRYVVGVTETVEAVLPDLRQRELLVALLAEQEPAVIRPPAEVIGSAHDRPPYLPDPREAPRRPPCSSQRVFCLRNPDPRARTRPGRSVRCGKPERRSGHRGAGQVRRAAERRLPALPVRFGPVRGIFV